MIFWPSCIKSAIVSSDTNEEFLISAMNSLPSGGIMRIAACGITISRIAIETGMPSERAASDLRDIGAGVHPHADDAAEEGWQVDAEMRQTEEPDEELHQERRAADEADIGRARGID